MGVGENLRLVDFSKITINSRALILWKTFCRRSRGGYDGDKGEGGGVERPKINLKSLDEKFDKAAEEERLKEFLRDDFIDDLVSFSTSFN